MIGVGRAGGSARISMKENRFFKTQVSVCCLLVLGLLSSLGCLKVPTYHLVHTMPHKDYVQSRIFIDQELDASSYKEIAQMELDRILKKRTSDQAPLYRVSFIFSDKNNPKGLYAKLVAQFLRTDTVDFSNPQVVWSTYLH